MFVKKKKKKRKRIRKTCTLHSLTFIIYSLYYFLSLRECGGDQVYRIMLYLLCDDVIIALVRIYC